VCYIPEAKTRNGKDHDIIKNNEQIFDFTPAAGRNLQAVFDEPAMTSDGGALLVRELLEQSALVKAVARIVASGHRTRSCKHPTEKILRQRIALICAGWFAADHSDALRHDPAMVLAAGGVPGDDTLASQPTVSRLENAVDTRMLLQIGYALVDDFVASRKKPPKAVVLDMDPAAIEVYGQQQLALFNAKEDGYCLMPFHVYDGLTGDLITTVIRPGKSPNAKEILAVVKRLVKRLKAAWPRTKLIFRADSTTPSMRSWTTYRRRAWTSSPHWRRTPRWRACSPMTSRQRSWPGTAHSALCAAMPAPTMPRAAGAAGSGGWSAGSS